MPTPPDVAAVKEYLGADASWSDDEVTSALATETKAQAAVCRIPTDPDTGPVPYPNDLAEALKRRVHRNLSMKALPLGYQISNSEFGMVTTRVGADPEVRRLEAPYRKRVVG